MKDFVFSFYRPRIKTSSEFVAQLNGLYRNNTKFARLIGTQVAPAWADGRLIAEVTPQHLPALEWWLAQFWARNSGMPQDEAVLRAEIGQAQLKGRRVKPDARARRAAKLRAALAELWSQAEAPSAKTLMNKQDAFAGVKRWQEANKTDLEKIAEWRDDAINLPFRLEEPMDLRPEAVNLPVSPDLDVSFEEHFEFVDTASDRSHAEWAHGTPNRDTVSIGGETYRYDELPDVAAGIILDAMMQGDWGTIEFVESALESYQEREARKQSWGYVSLTDDTGTVSVRVRTWTEPTGTWALKDLPFLPEEMRKAPEPKRVVEVPAGEWYHPSITDWEAAARRNKGIAEAYDQFLTEQAEAQARRELLDKDDEAAALDHTQEETPASILELLTEDREEREELGEEIPAWLERQIAFYTHVVNKANQTQAATAPTTVRNTGILEGVQNVLENTRAQLEAELELTNKARTGLVSQLAYLRMLAQQAA